MGLKKCPKCEINYIRDDQQYCEVCSRKHKLRERDEDDADITLCAECGEHPAMKGRELCKYCYAEKMKQEKLLKQHSASFGDETDEAADEDEDEIDDEASADDDELSEADPDEADDEYDADKESMNMDDDYDNRMYLDD